MIKIEFFNQDWSMDFVFDRTAEGRVIKSLTVVDDAPMKRWLLFQDGR